VYVVEGQRLRKPGLVGPTEKLVLLVRVTPAPARIAVELYRGDQLRDRQEWTPQPIDGVAELAVGLGRSATLTGSSRLRCRLHVDGHLIGERTILLGRPAVDAQGRLAGQPAVASAAHTPAASREENTPRPDRAIRLRWWRHQ
jgi:hypothetical protein